MKTKSLETKRELEEQINKESNLIKTVEVEDTVFTIVEVDGNHRVAIGRNIVSTRMFETVIGARDWIDSKPWELLINTVVILYNTLNNKENEK